MKLSLYLLRRYLRFDKTQPFISITALLAFVGVGIGVMVLIVAMSIMNGVTNEFQKRLFVMNYPLSVYATTSSGVNETMLYALKTKFPNLSFSPFLRYQAVMKLGNSMNAGILFGIDLGEEVKINETLKNAVNDSKMDIETFNNYAFPLLSSKMIRDNFGVNDGDKLILFFTQLEPSGFGLTPLNRSFSIQGHFTSGLRAYDNAYFYTNISSLQKIRRLPSGIYDGIHIYSSDPMKEIESVEKFLDTEFHGMAGVEGWWEQNGNFFSAMELEKRALFIVLMLIILMASLNIISSLLMVIMNRRKEIALLLSLGASKEQIKKSFFYLGNVIGLSGVVLGVVLSFVAMWVLSTFPIVSLPADVYGSDKLPILLSMWDLLATIVGSTLIVAISSYYPAHRASKLDVLNILRNE